MSKAWHLRSLIPWVCLALAAVVPWTVSPYWLKVLTIGLLYSYLSSAWNIIGGYGGQLSLGHSLFFGIGSYSVALLSVRAGFPGALGLLAGPLLAALAAWMIGFICFRSGLKGVFFSVATLLIAEIVRVLATSSALLNRSQGLSLPMGGGLRDLDLGFTTPYYYYTALVLLVGCLALVSWLARSRLGYGLIAVREQEEGAEALGVHSSRTKLVALILSAVLTAIGGVFHASLVRFVQPQQDLSIAMSLTPIICGILGGRGTVYGPVIGGIVLMGIQQGLSLIGMAVGSTRFYSMVQAFYGGLLMLVILLVPQGLLSFKRLALGSRK